MQIILRIYFCLLNIRYKFKIIGLEKIDKNKKYVIFPNHQAIVDPQIVIGLLSQKIKVSPVVTQTYYDMFPFLFKSLGAISIGDLQRGTGNIDEVKNSIKGIEKGLKDGKNILLYPAGQIYSQGFESIKGKKSAYNLVQNLDNDTEIILLKTTGLFGSMWSKARNGKSPNFIKTFFHSMFIILSNLILLTPRRNVKIEIENYTDKLKNIKDLNNFNKTLEDFYNKDGEEKIKYRRHYFFYDDSFSKREPVLIQGSLKDLKNTKEIKEDEIPKNISEKIFSKIKEIKEDLNSKENITLKTNLINDLYFDSLDLSEIKTYIQTNFENSDNPAIITLKTVGDLCIMAIGKSDSIEELKPCNWSKEIKEEKLSEIILENKQKLSNNTSILSLWKEIFSKNTDESFLYDNIFGLQSRKDFILKAYLIADYIKNIDGKYIGIMLPSVASANIIIISTYLAGKIPVMLNWTVGEKSLIHCTKFAKVNNVLTSKSFYDKIKNIGTEKIKDKYIFLEDLLKNISIFKKLKAFFDSTIFNIPKVDFEDEAVILFTSGSESLPKTVSLTHKNIISNIIGSLHNFPITNKEKLIGFLPPFHSFGFTINTIMPLITGLKVAYTPDPTDSKTILNLINHCQTTTLTATPSFLNMILEISSKDKLKTLKYAVVGAEKCPSLVQEKFKKLCPNGQILEGYGITECSPVISINPPGKGRKGSVGIPIYKTNVKIISLEDKKELKKQEIGMIYFAGDNVFNGYLDKDIENPFEYFEGRKYYKTGDLGFLDENGYIFITGRLKRFVKIAGEMISLPFVEEILNKKYSGIAIEALEKNSEVKIILFSLKENKIDLGEVNLFLKENGVSNLVKISEIKFLEKLPVLGTGKIDYKILKNMIN